MLKKIIKNNLKEFKPSEFMRARRPELFSDSRTLKERHLQKEVLEYHLENLTHLKKEIQFEYFCRKLAEKEICPNLLPQTGPTGGGDSKVDSETYPVADKISLRWYEGVGCEASQERWAFAFSAKKDWRSKVRSDVKKIASTCRGYKLIYFITNQFVSDKNRAKVEDNLKKKYNIAVRILDRSWIVERIFKNNHLNLAIETLNLTGYDEDTKKVIGPHDTRRKLELQKLEDNISDQTRYHGVEYQLVEDCLQVALLARGLELSRVEVDGRFDRAERFAEKIGNPQQLLKISYNKAWTAFWWYDDFNEFNKQYDYVEKFALNSKQATDLELLTNLWQLLYTTVRCGKCGPKVAKIKKRTTILKKRLNLLGNDEKRLNNALQARTNLLLMKLAESIKKPEQLNKALKDLKDILITSEGLLNYPLIPLTKIVLELGEFLPENTIYSELFETIVKLTEERTSEGEAGIMLLQRGLQNLRSRKNYDAIRLLGRAQQKLGKHEYKVEYITSLLGCASAYEAAGLLWASRSNMLVATNQALSYFWEYGELTSQALTCLQKMVWLEMQLGRVPCILAWMETAYAIANNLGLEKERKDSFLKERETQDLVLGMLILKTKLWDLIYLESLPDIFDYLNLPYARMAVLYVLGYENSLREEGFIPSEQNANEVREFFWKWLNQPAKDDIPGRPELLLNPTVQFTSFVLGSKVIIESANNLTSLFLSETILGALESFFATSLDKRIFPYRSEIRLQVKPTKYIYGLPKYKFNESNSKQLLEIFHPTKIVLYSKDEQSEFRSWLTEFIIKVLTIIAIVEDSESYFKNLLKNEGVFGRIFSYSDNAIAVTNILGEKPKYHLSDWNIGKKIRCFFLKREKTWNEDLEQTVERGKEEKLIFPKIGEGLPKKKLFGIDNLKHSERPVFSLINVPLWNKAEWKATAYIYSPDIEAVPIIALGFRNEEAAKAIFRDWQIRLGKIDNEEQLRLSIITGIDQSNPSSYSVVIGINPKLYRKKSKSSQFILVCRINRMVPKNSKNLNNFIKNYKHVGQYILAPCLFENSSIPPKLFVELGIKKRKLHLCPAWKLSENDPEISALNIDTPPIIPDGVKNPPVNLALKWIKKHK